MMRASFVVIAMSLGCGGSAATPAGTDVLTFSLASLPSPPADVRSRLVPGTPPTETTKVTCKEASIEIGFERRSDPQTSAVYFDALRVRVLDAKGAKVSARQGNVENRGTATAVEMAFPIIVSVFHGKSGGECSYLISAKSGIQPV